MTRWMALALAVCLLACNTVWAQAKDLSELPWLAGPSTGQIGDKASIGCRRAMPSSGRTGRVNSTA